jgi:RHS repeat-associated protein
VNNRLTDTGFSYDASGNMLTDGTNTYTYDAENLLTAAGVTYTYDGDGDRVQKSSGKLYWYGAGSDALDETDGSGNLTDEYIFFGGKRIARRDSSSNVDYYFADHLGSARVITNSSGTILDDSDFTPFGVEMSHSSGSGNRYKFTGKERDSESGLDNFTARFYASTTGRFMSADDAKYVTAADPQTWNLYGYVANNPVNAVDPTGHAPNGYCNSCNMQALDETSGPADDDLASSEADHDADINYTRDCIQTADDCKGEESGTNSGDGSGDQAATNAQRQAQNTAGYKTADEAAAAALAIANPTSIKENVEYGGFVYRDKAGLYHYTEPIEGDRDGVDLSSIAEPPDTTPVGDYHTHGDYTIVTETGQKIRTSDPMRDSYNSDDFTGADKKGVAAIAKKYPGYVGYLGTPSGKFLVYDPAAKKKERELK